MSFIPLRTQRVFLCDSLRFRPYNSSMILVVSKSPLEVHIYTLTSN